MDEIIETMSKIIHSDNFCESDKYSFPIVCGEQNKIELFNWINRVLTVINSCFPTNICGFLFPRDETMKYLDYVLVNCTIFKFDGVNSMVNENISYPFIFYFAEFDPFIYHQILGDKISIKYKIVDVFDIVQPYCLFRLTLCIEGSKTKQQIPIIEIVSLATLILKMKDTIKKISV